MKRCEPHSRHFERKGWHRRRRGADDGEEQARVEAERENVNDNGTGQPTAGRTLLPLSRGLCACGSSVVGTWVWGDVLRGECATGHCTLQRAEGKSAQPAAAQITESGVGVGKLVFVVFGRMHVLFGSDIGVRSQTSQTECVCQSHSLTVRRWDACASYGSITWTWKCRGGDALAPTSFGDRTQPKSRRHERRRASAGGNSPWHALTRR